MTDRIEEQLAKIIELLIEINKNITSLREEIRDLGFDIRGIL